MGGWHIRVCAAVTAVLGAGLWLAGRMTGGPGVPVWERAANELLTRSGAGTFALGALVLGLALLAPGRRVIQAIRVPEDDPPSIVARPYRALFWISFVALFAELLLIRYCSSQLRVFAFYKNVPLIGAFLGLGVGCALGGGSTRDAQRFALWLFPVATFLSIGSIAVGSGLGRHAALGSSEQILGDAVPSDAEAGRQLGSQLLMALVCVVTLIVLTLLFVQLGRILGRAFGRVERVPGYTVNIVGSLAGVLAFAALSYLEQPPALWVAVGLAPLLLWMPTRRSAATLLVLLALDVMAVSPTWGETVWSRYQRLIGHPVTVRDTSAYRVEISDVFYQMAVDRRPETLARGAPDLYPHYDAIYRATGPVRRVLVVGAGMGNDVAAALRAGAERVDAVEIDPAIVRLGRKHHPERPYDDPRVHVVVDDARHAFRVLRPGWYDAVVFGLLDSHTQLGHSSVRLDNYVFTLQSFAEAARLVRPGGHLVVTAATYRTWLYRRIGDMLRRTTGGDVLVSHSESWWTWVAAVGEPRAGSVSDADASGLPTDDWPFLYLPRHAVPAAYLVVLAALTLVSFVVVRRAGLPSSTFTLFHGHLFLLGAAFLLMEVHAIDRLALLFGTTWIVSAVAISLVLLLIVAANLLVLVRPSIPYRWTYAGLAAALAASFLARPETALGGGTAAAAGVGLLVLSPVFFAGLIFARSFRASPAAAPAMGANILGAVPGGWLEYSTMALGVRFLVLLAAALYALSWILLALSRDGRAGRADSGLGGL